MTEKTTSRRSFVKSTAASGIALSILPSHILAGSGKVAPNSRLNVALIGSGTQALKQLPEWLSKEDLQFTAVCDCNKESYDYPLWGAPKGEKQGAPGGREIGKKMIEEYYAKQTGKNKYKGCKTYNDFREMFEKEKDLDAVFIMTPDHLHATIAVAAMKKGLMTGSHKPIGNFMSETRITCDLANETGVRTQLFAYRDLIQKYQIKDLIDKGTIGKVKELHRWTNRPMWPQGSPYLPTNTPPIPEGFDWDLWLGPSLPRKYSPDYTHTAFRGWYEFGAGCLADMGYYGFWIDWLILNLGMPLVAEGSKSFTCEIKDFRSSKVNNELSYPHAATLQWEVPVNDSNDMMDVYWYEGGIRPKTPKALRDQGKSMPREGVMFVGDQGVLMAEYMFKNIELIGVKDGESIMKSMQEPNVKLINYNDEMIASFKGGDIARGDFRNAQTIAEAICLGNLAIRMDQRLEWDNEKLKVTNVPEANEYLARKCREGWEL